ncbi:MAG: GHMP kinase, partial [Chloroflexi bacterium]|nr:GHMP kinase [Chloroflexota bacterium]
MEITATVPMRIDLAGGTLDVYPLYIFEGGGLTVNAAIDIRATAVLRTRSDARITIRSTDQDEHEEIASFAALDATHGITLVKRALAYYQPTMGLDIVVSSAAPRGSGIGASSALLMALSHCLNTVTSRGLSTQQIIDVGANIEAQVISIPTGKQDYFPPNYGGVGAIWFGIDGWRHESLSTGNDLIDRLNRRIVVSYTGIPHSSAATNWAMLKAYIEREGDSAARMGEIKAISSAMRDCLSRQDLVQFPALVDAEWKLRRGLAKGVSNPEIEAIMAAAAQAGAQASKICGAGGGGCMITVAEPARVPAVRRALQAAGAAVLDAHLVAQGIDLQVIA